MKMYKFCSVAQWVEAIYKNWKVPSSNPTWYLTYVWDWTSLQWFPLDKVPIKKYIKKVLLNLKISDEIAVMHLEVLPFEWLEMTNEAIRWFIKFPL